MGVSIFFREPDYYSMDLNHQNFCWLMNVLQLSYTHEAQKMDAELVLEKIRAFSEIYLGCYTGANVKEKKRLWVGLCQSKRSPSPIMADVMDGMGGNVIDLGPDYADLGDPFKAGTDANRLFSQMTGYVGLLKSMAKHCKRTNQVLEVC